MVGRKRDNIYLHISKHVVVWLYIIFCLPYFHVSNSVLFCQVLLHSSYHSRRLGANYYGNMPLKNDDVIKWKHFPLYWPFVPGIPGEFPAQRPLTRSFGVFFDLRLNKGLSKQSGGWWFVTPSRPLWGHRNGNTKLTTSLVCRCSASIWQI